MDVPPTWKFLQDVELSSGTGLRIVVAADAAQSESLALEIGFQRIGVSLPLSQQVALRAT
jgi:hypothetical protein